MEGEVMYKKELVDKVVDSTKMRFKDVDLVYNAILDTIKKELYNGEEVVLTGFGTFRVNNRKERKGINPRNGSVIDILPKRVVTFKSSLAFKSYMNDRK